MLTGFKDVAAKYDILLQYFKDLRQTNRFLTEKEFENLSDKNWRQTHPILAGCSEVIIWLRRFQNFT